MTSTSSSSPKSAAAPNAPNAPDVLELIDILQSIEEGAARRLTKGHDNGGEQTLALARRGLSLLGMTADDPPKLKDLSADLFAGREESHRIHGFVVPAIAMTSDGKVHALFDAAPFLSTLSRVCDDQSLGDLVTTGRANNLDPEAEAGQSLATNMAWAAGAHSTGDSDTDVFAVLQHSHELVCQLHVPAVQAWMKTNRPDLMSGSENISALQVHQVIYARVRTNDGLVEAHFDATRWFELASDPQLVALVANRLGACDSGDDVASFFKTRNPAVAQVFKHCQQVVGLPTPQQSWFGHVSGYECYVDEDEARAWLKVNRAGVYSQFFDEDGLSLHPRLGGREVQR